MSKLTLTLVQSNLAWQDAASNRDLLAHMLDGMETNTDLIIMPEMFTSAFSMDAKAVAEPHPGDTLQWMQALAKEKDAALTGSIAVLENGQRFNRLLFVTPEQVHYYDKRHLFRMLGEHERYSSGSDKRLIHWRGWDILPLVCYDLRFPVWSRNRPSEPYDLLLYVANWPAPRSAHWTTLLKARAIENLTYVVGVNRIGTDGNAIDYHGQSAVYDFRGEELLNADTGEGCYTVTVDKEALKTYRQQFPAHLDADHFEII